MAFCTNTQKVADVLQCIRQHNYKIVVCPSDTLGQAVKSIGGDTSFVGPIAGFTLMALPNVTGNGENWITIGHHPFDSINKWRVLTVNLKGSKLQGLQ